jgi:hypothetical protein
MVLSKLDMPLSQELRDQIVCEIIAFYSFNFSDLITPHKFHHLKSLGSSVGEETLSGLLEITQQQINYKLSTLFVG